MNEIKKAIDNLKETLRMQKSALRGLPTSYQPKAGLNDDIKATDLAISALEKQIPKKPLGIENDNRYGCVLECFECKTILSGSEERPLYCPECGQAIDWSVEE